MIRQIKLQSLAPTIDMIHGPLTTLTLATFALPPIHLPLRAVTRPLIRNRPLRMMSLPAVPVLQRTSDRDSANTLDNLLADDKYHIEFQGYLSNHVKHALIALGGLQAPAKTIKAYHDQYTTTTPYGFTLDPAEQLVKDSTPLSHAEWEALLGRKEEYPRLLQFFRAAIDKEGTEAVLQRYGPKLLEGFPGALTHGIIHLGWALDAGHRDMTIEGLAYFSYCHVTVRPERFRSSACQEDTPLQSMMRIAQAAEEGDLGSWVQATKSDPNFQDVHPELAVAGFQHVVAKVIARGHPLLSDLPTWLDTLPLPDLFEALYRDVTLLYLATAGQPSPSAGDHGNFLILHAITSLWALEYIVKPLPEDAVRHGLKCYWSGLSALLVAAAGGSGIPSRAALTAVRAAFPQNAADSVASVGGEWEATVQRAYGEEEEHNIKLVYVERELWRRYRHWPAFRVAAKSFTVTPNIGPGRAAYKS